MKKHYLLTLIIILTINFFLPRLMPGDPFVFLAVEDGNTSAVFTPEQIDKYKAYYGLDKPLHEQYFAYLFNLLRGDFGYSIYFNTGVANIIWTRMHWTVLMVVSSLVLSCMVGTVLGCFSAWHREGAADKAMYAGMIIFSEIPPFLVGVFLLFTFAAKLRWFPMAGGISAFARFDTVLEYAADIVRHAVLPVITLSLARVGDFYLLSRNSMLTVLSKDYMRTARAKGLKQTRILFRHALRNALMPIVTRIFMSLGTVFGGAVLVENVFNYPGIGRLMREAVMVRDYILIQGIFLFIALSVVGMNWLAEWIYKRLDPRVS